MNDFLKTKLIPKTIVFFHPIESDFIDNLIITSERIRNPSAQFSHVLFIGRDVNCYESTIHLKIPFQDGVKCSTIEERFENVEKDYEYIAIQTLPNISDVKWHDITMAAIKKLNAKPKIHYAVLELFGTLWQILKWKYWGLLKRLDKQKEILLEKNPLNTSAVYCCAFINDCFNDCGLDWIDPKIENSQSIVDDGFDSPILHVNEIIRII